MYSISIYEYMFISLIGKNYVYVILYCIALNHVMYNIQSQPMALIYDQTFSKKCLVVWDYWLENKNVNCSYMLANVYG